MRLSEIEGDYKVIKHSNKEVLFKGNRETCIDFIKGFDRGSSKYVDLRLMDPEGKEDDWHKD